MMRRAIGERWHRRPLSVRLTLWHSLLFLASSLGLLASTYALFSNRAKTNEQNAIVLRAKLYASEYRRGGLEAVQRLAAIRPGRTQRAFFVRVTDDRNRILFERDPGDWSEFDLEPLGAMPLPAPETREWKALHSPESTLLIAVERLADGRVLQVGKSTEGLDDMLREYRRSALLMLLIFVPASFAGGAFLASRALRPVQQLTDAAQEIVATDRFDARVPAPCTGDELDALVRVFNEMLGRIDVLVRGMRDSLDNVAHDLRTPLTRLRAQAQGVLSSAQDEPGCPHCRLALDTLGSCVEEADRVGAMLDTLMEIAEADAQLTKLRRSSVSLKTLVVETIAAYAEFAEERGVEVTADVQAAPDISADPTALSRVFANLLDNAIKYTPRGGRVVIAARGAGDNVAISFADTGSGIAPEDLSHIWERLFRGDRSRSERGLGLGLSFVRAITEAHGGSVSATSTPGCGTTISISLPIG